MLHHNKPKSNYHIHLIFPDRDLLKKTQVKYASRNMYYNEQGHHVRMKKEALDADGNHDQDGEMDMKVLLL